ncbi:carboxypeptidase regulatory-like domain-containing protein [Ramlibacter sp. WS9]|uniref:carboxypeptidase regulatory-like domain-containing protein n=1 Tax=Ramlibacter sp. WS9 TaxID=1882741 RepID=UPI0011438E7C|nr:carboxypeptidase regulatory-like domain-containing protein [Ramlibacter sp. WS9]ROZ79736.1 hypothetical protein EEB15_02190 [Ramlibacter sp. WS9]
MRKRLAAWAASGWDSVRALKRGLLAALALTMAAAVLGAPADVARGLAWLQSQVRADGSFLGQPLDGGQQLARCETATTLIKLAGNSAQVASLLAALQSSDGATETQACWQQLRQQLGQTILGSDVEQRRVPQQGYSAYPASTDPNALDSGWALSAQLQNLTPTDKTSVLGWLQGIQRAEGSFAVAGKPSLLTTTVVLRALKVEASNNTTAASIANKAASWLLAQRNAQGNWLGDIATTAVVFEAVHPYTGADAGIAGGVQTYLLAQQQPDGSWQGDAYATAVALRALALTSVSPQDPTRAGLKIKFADARTGTAVPGVRLESINPAVSALADGAGQVQLAGLQPGAYQFAASLSGYATVTISATLAAGQTLDLGVIQLILPTGSTASVVSGTVREQGSNLPVPDATVTVEGQARSAVSAPDGSYLISNVTPGTVTLVATRTGYLAASGKGTVAAGQVLNFSPWLSADPGNVGATDCKIVGVVLDAATQQPMAGVSVNVTGSSAAAVSTDAAGRYATPNLVTGVVTVKTSKAGYDSVTATTQLICTNLRSTVVEFSPRIYATGQTPAGGNSAGMSGVVMDAATNQPIAGAQLTATPSFGAAKSTQSAADGKFQFSGLDGVSAQLQVTASGYEGVTQSYALTPLQTIDIGQLRLRAPKVQQLLPDLKVVQVQRDTARTDAQTLALSGSVQVQVANVGTQASPSEIALTAFVDADRNNRYDAATDPVVGMATLAITLPPGGTSSVAISVQGVMPFRDAPVHVMVDSAAAVAEVDETNNVRSLADEALLLPTSKTFDPVLKWSWSGGGVLPLSKDVMMAPIAVPTRDTNGDGKINGDDVSNVIFTSYQGYYSQAGSGVIRILDGRTGAEINTLSNSPVATVGGLAAADLDGDGVPEIVGMSAPSARPIALRPDGSVLWAATTGTVPYWAANGGNWSAPLIADLDADGIPEVISSNNVYNGRTGQFKWKASGPHIGTSDTQFPAYYSIPVVADLFGTGKQNLILGASVYEADGTPVWIKTNAVDGYGDGHIGIADFDRDGFPELVLVSAAKVWLLDRFGNKIWGPIQIPNSNIWGGPPTIADFDGDGVPDIGVATTRSYAVLRANGTIMWTSAAKDFGSGMTGSTSFDFHGDGKPKVVYSDESSIFVLDGATGVVSLRIPSSSATTFEYPIVIDADRDGHAEFVTIRNNYAGHADSAPGSGIRVYQDKDNSWVGTRGIWNQHVYSITNINDDLTVPRVPVQSWKSHNTYRLNKRLEADARAVPDLTVGYVRVADGGSSGSTLTVRAGNAGGYKVAVGAKLAVYASNPALGTPTASALVGTATVPSELQPNEWRDIAIPVNKNLASLNALGQIWIVGDDDGTGKTAFIDFDRSNNTVAGDLPLIAANLAPIVSTDKPVYSEADQAVFTAVGRNFGSFAHDAYVRFSVLDSASLTVDTLPVGVTASLPASGTASIAGLWPVSGILSGNYQVRADLYSPAGLLYGSATASFVVSASQVQATSARISADRLSYSTAQSVQLTSRVANNTSNTALDNLQARTEVRTGAGQSVMVRTEPIEQLAANGFRQYGYSLGAGTLAPSNYGATLQLLAGNGSVLAQSTTSFSVLGADQTGVGITGQLQAVPDILFVGQNSHLTLQVTNNSTMSLSSVPLTVRVVDPVLASVVATFTTTVADWTAGEARSFGFDWSALGEHGQNLVAVASAVVAGKDIPLAQANLKILGILFTGTIAADPREVEAGDQTSLAYGVTNPTPVAGRMTGNVAVQTQAGQTLTTWPLDLAIAGMANFAGNQLYTTGEQLQTLTAVLSQHLGTSTSVLATTTFTIIDRPVPLGVATGLKGQARILVLVSCPPGLGAADEAACVAQRSQAIVTYFSGLGITAKTVTTRDAFAAEMCCGSYNTYWLSGGATKLDAQTVGELEQTVYRGEALWMDGVHDSRNQLLHPAAGVKEIGKLSTSNQVEHSLEPGLYGAGDLPTLGQPTKFELTTGAAQGLFTQVPGQQAPVPAIVSNDHGRGKSLLFAFDLAAMITADVVQANSQLAGFVSTSASYGVSGSPTLTLGDITQLSASINNQGTRTVSFKAEATLPAALASISTAPQAQLTVNTDGSTLATWNFTLAGGATQELNWLVRATQAGSYSVPLSIYSMPNVGSSLPPKLRVTTTFVVDVKDAASLVQQPLPAATALEPTASADKSNKTKALSAIANAQSLHAQGSYEQAIVQWLAAADAIAGITSVDTAAARAAVALALEATTDALCIQRCGTAACQ